jgi:hypothetical protein
MNTLKVAGTYPTNAKVCSVPDLFTIATFDLLLSSLVCRGTLGSTRQQPCT